MPEKEFIPNTPYQKQKQQYYDQQAKAAGLVPDEIGDPATATRDEATGLVSATIQDVADYNGAEADSIAAAMTSSAGSTKGAPTAGPPPSAGITQAPAPREIDVSGQYLEDATLEDAMMTGVGIGNTDVTTREVLDEELVSNQLAGLLDEDSAYIRNARMRAIEAANARGGFGSSFAAGAAERSAMEAALPIATADAQAYRDMATQNMNALNSMALANLQRATSLDTALLSSNTQRQMANLDAGIRTSIANLDAMTKIDISNLDAATRTRLGNLQAATQLRVQEMADANARYMQGKQLTHETGLEQLRQEGRVELSMMDAQLQTRLAKFAHEGRLELQSLDHEQQKEMQDIIQEYDYQKHQENMHLTRQTERNNLAMQAELNYMNYVTAYANTDMDSAAARRLAEDSWNRYSNTINIINSEYPDLEPVTAQRMDAPVGTSDGKTGGKKDDGRPNHRGG